MHFKTATYDTFYFFLEPLASCVCFCAPFGDIRRICPKQHFSIYLPSQFLWGPIFWLSIRTCCHLRSGLLLFPAIASACRLWLCGPKPVIVWLASNSVQVFVRQIPQTQRFPFRSVSNSLFTSRWALDNIVGSANNQVSRTFWQVKPADSGSRVYIRLRCTENNASTQYLTICFLDFVAKYQAYPKGKCGKSEVLTNGPPCLFGFTTVHCACSYVRLHGWRELLRDL